MNKKNDRKLTSEESKKELHKKFDPLFKGIAEFYKKKEKKENKDGKYWYSFNIVECPVCGRTDKYKERRYSKRPKHKVDRYNYRQEYCYCQDRE